jgi:hypothetical protein
MGADLFPQNGRPVEAPWRLALITVMQFIEELVTLTPLENYKVCVLSITMKNGKTEIVQNMT